jgi:hypothetical protein
MALRFLLATTLMLRINYFDLTSVPKQWEATEPVHEPACVDRIGGVSTAVVQ